MTRCSSCDQSFPSLKKCAHCLQVSYCSTECQRQHWKVHKKECQVSVDVVVLNGRVATLEKHLVSGFTPKNGWLKLCPVPTMLGIPLVVKTIRPYPNYNVVNSQPAVFLLTEPNTGFAPIGWQLGRSCNKGMLGFARTDGIPFTTHAYSELQDFLYNLMDTYSDDGPEAAVREIKNCTRFRS